MPSTDIDGSPIVILSEEEARLVYNIIKFRWQTGCPILDLERHVARKIARDLTLLPEELFNGLG